MLEHIFKRQRENYKEVNHTYYDLYFFKLLK